MRLLLALILLSSSVVAQDSIDSLNRMLLNHPDDSNRVKILNRISFLNLAYSLDSMEVYADRAIELAKKLDYARGLAEGYKNLGTAYYAQGNTKLGLEQLFQSLKISEQIGYRQNNARVLHNIGRTYFYQGDYSRSLEFTKRAIDMFGSVNDIEGKASAQLAACDCYVYLKEPNEALQFCEDALQVFEKTGNKERQAHALRYLGGVYALWDQREKAKQLYWKASRLVNTGDFLGVGVYLNQDLSKLYMGMKKYDSAACYLYKALGQLKRYESKDGLMLAYRAMSDLHEQTKRFDSALYYSKKYVELTKDDFDLRRNDQLEALETHYNLELTSQKLLLNQEILNSQRNMIIFIGVILVVVIVSAVMIFSLYLKYRKANVQLTELNASINEKNEEILAQTDEVKAVNEAMQLINSNLEEIVEERTREVKMRNDQLVQYAYFNAHKVRGPLARILGLVNLLQMKETDSELQLFTDKMRESAHELDEVVREINKKLDTD